MERNQAKVVLRPKNPSCTAHSSSSGAAVLAKLDGLSNTKRYQEANGHRRWRAAPCLRDLEFDRPCPRGRFLYIDCTWS